MYSMEELKAVDLEVAAAIEEPVVEKKPRAKRTARAFFILKNPPFFLVTFFYNLKFGFCNSIVIVLFKNLKSKEIILYSLLKSKNLI